MYRTKAEALDSRRWPLAGTMIKSCLRTVGASGSAAARTGSGLFGLPGKIAG